MSAEKKNIPNEEFFSAVRQTLEEGKDVDFTVTGNSMWPLLKHGRDRVVLRKTEIVKKGDVVLFEALPSKYMLHRVTQISEDNFETTGDCNSFRDGRFPKSCVIGKAVRIIRKEKSYSIESFLIKIYSALWMRLFVFRKPALKLLLFLSKHGRYKFLSDFLDNIFFCVI